MSIKLADRPLDGLRVVGATTYGCTNEIQRKIIAKAYGL